MQGEVRIVLIAENLERNISRFWRAEIGTDLFGSTLLAITFGRTGTVGRTIERPCDDIPSARLAIQRMLRRRATAPRRLGVPYLINEIVGFDVPSTWQSQN